VKPRTALDVTATTSGKVTLETLKPPYAVVDTTPDEVRDETFLPAPGQVRYTLILSDEQVELLSRGVVSEALCCRAYKMLEWKRTQQRVRAR
jgi:hypothetical protein